MKQQEKKLLTSGLQTGQTVCTSTLAIGNPAPRKICGFFMSGFQPLGPLTQARASIRQMSKNGANRITPGTKAGNRTNNRGRFITVVEPCLRHPLRGRFNLL